MSLFELCLSMILIAPNINLRALEKYVHHHRHYDTSIKWSVNQVEELIQLNVVLPVMPLLQKLSGSNRSKLALALGRESMSLFIFCLYILKTCMANHRMVALFTLHHLQHGIRSSIIIRHTYHVDDTSFRREYMTRLAELTFNSRPIIESHDSAFVNACSWSSAQDSRVYWGTY